MLSFSSPTRQTSLPASAQSDPSHSNRPTNPVHTASLIVPRLYLSNFLIARDETQLRSLGITHVLSILEHAPKYSSHVKTLHIALSDTSSSNILDHLQATTDFIKSALAENENNKVLVHCLMGISRSATVVCAYLVATTPMLAHEAIDFVIARRSVVCPNLSFRKQLEVYATRFYGKGEKVNGITAVGSKGRVALVSQGLAERIRKLKALGGSGAYKTSSSSSRGTAVVSSYHDRTGRSTNNVST